MSERLRDPEPPEPRYSCRECGVILGEDDGDYCPECEHRAPALDLSPRFNGVAALAGLITELARVTTSGTSTSYSDTVEPTVMPVWE